MSVREYIGARYVPVFADPIQWDPTKSYEPLTVVEYQGNSYTSRQPVPIGIDISNVTFWALTGNYNAQVEAYREEVETYTRRIEGIMNTYQNVEGMQEDNSLIAGTYVQTLGYNAIGDNGGNTYYVTSSNETADGGSVIDIDNGLKAIAVGSIASPEKWGADNKGISDSSAAINACVEYNKGNYIEFLGGRFLITSAIQTPFDSNLQVDIIGNESTIIPNCAHAFEIGYTNKTETENTAGVNFSKIRNLIINDENLMCNIGIITAFGYKDLRIDSCEIYSCKTAIQFGNDPSNIRPGDHAITNCMLRGRNNSDFGAGVIFQCSDCRIYNSYIYRFAPSIENHGSAHWFINVHVLNNLGTTSAEKQAWNDTAFCKMYAGSISCIGCTADSCHTIIDSANGGTKIDWINGTYMLAFDDVPFTLFEIADAGKILRICNSYFSLPTPAAGSNVARIGINHTGSTALNFNLNNMLVLDNNFVMGTTDALSSEYDLITAVPALVNAQTSLAANTNYLLGSVCAGLLDGERLQLEVNIGAATITLGLQTGASTVNVTQIEKTGTFPTGSKLLFKKATVHGIQVIVIGLQLATAATIVSNLVWKGAYTPAILQFHPGGAHNLPTSTETFTNELAL